MITERKPRERKRAIMVNRLSGTALENALAEMSRRLKVYGEAQALRDRAWKDYLAQREVVHSAG